jgi:Tfp pilus assembly protein PilF
VNLPEVPILLAGVQMFNKALEIEPDYMMAHFGLTWAYEHHYHVTDSMEDLETAQKMSELVK